MKNPETIPREASNIYPDCNIFGNGLCTFEIRHILRLCKEKDLNPNELSKDQLRDLLQSRQKSVLLMKKPKNGLKSNKDSPDYKLIPNSKKYHTQKQGKMNMRFESQTGRKENILL